MRNYLLLTLLLCATGVAAQSQSPYAGQQHRAIKALSDEEIQGLLQGHGMGLARAAELNRYPGPRHVLDLAEQLELTAGQISQTRQIFDEMHTTAVDLGQKIIDAERALDTAFASGTVDDASLRRRLAALGTLRGELRYVHLRAHLAQTRILSEHQRKLYQRKRGYHDGAPHNGHNH
jgi:Spy/CpxP family protein refolding chaperone